MDIFDPAEVKEETIWRAQPGPQFSLVTCPVFEVFYGGARGGGKTDGVLGDFIFHAAQYGRSAIGLMVRRTRTELIETIERSRDIYGKLGWTFGEQDKMWRSPDGARLRFAYLERDADAEAYQGHSYTRVYVEELGNFPTPRPIMKLMATLRSAAGVPVGFRATGNPGGPGHSWVKLRYIDPAPAGWVRMTDADSGLERIYIPSRVADNKYLDDGYVARLRMSGSESLVKAWLEGDWNAIEGAFFDCWSTSKHVVAPFAIPQHWLRFRSMDWGSAAPFSIGWWAVASEPHIVGGNDDGSRATIPRGCLVRYREWYGTGDKLTAEEVAEGILEREKSDVDEAGKSLIQYGVLDPATFAEDGGPSIAERMGRVLGKAGHQTFRKADNRRVPQAGAMGGWDQMRARLKGDGDGNPMVVCFSTCTDSIRTIPVLQHDPDRPEDLDTDAEDHCFTAGTLVDTDCGPVPIERVVPGKHRIWSGGYWHYAFNAKLTSFDAETVRLKFDDGTEIVCTPRHMFLDCSGEWRYAEDLLNVEVSCDQSSSLRRSRSLTGCDSISVGSIFRDRVSDCIERFGNFIMGRSRTGRTSIIRMAIDRTMTPTIWNAFRLLSIWGRYTAKKAAIAHVTACQKLATPLPSGMVVALAEIGISDTSTNTSDQKWNNEYLRCVRNAARSTEYQPPRSSRANTVALTVAPRRCVSVESGQRSAVYCLEVPATSAFTIQGGMIVHNCADDWRYGCMSRPWTRPAPRADAPIVDLAIPTLRDVVRATERRRGAGSGRI